MHVSCVIHSIGEFSISGNAQEEQKAHCHLRCSIHISLTSISDEKQNSAAEWINCMRSGEEKE